jgi:hypothetical protein
MIPRCPQKAGSQTSTKASHVTRRSVVDALAEEQVCLDGGGHRYEVVEAGDARGPCLGQQQGDGCRSAGWPSAPA